MEIGRDALHQASRSREILNGGIVQGLEIWQCQSNIPHLLVRVKREHDFFDRLGRAGSELPAHYGFLGILRQHGITAHRLDFGHTSIRKHCGRQFYLALKMAVSQYVRVFGSHLGKDFPFSFSGALGQQGPSRNQACSKEEGSYPAASAGIEDRCGNMLFHNVIQWRSYETLEGSLISHKLSRK